MATLEGIIDSLENLEVKRALAVKMFLLDFKTEDICKLLNVSDSFVSKWKITYENEGASALKVNYQGGTGFLTEVQRIQIFLHLRDKPHYSVEELRDYIEQHFGVVYQSKGSSLPLQRVMADFGADHPFAPAAAKLKEHYGIDVPVSTVQRTTEHHAQCLYEQEAAREIAPGASAACFIGEIDGSMVPVVEPSAASADQRKGKVLSWKEVRLTLVHRHGSVSPVFGGHFAGGVEESGRQWGRCAAKAGFGPASHRHGLGDGAPWIVNQFDRHFGTQGRYLIDFFPVCDYLSAAAPVCAADHAQAWLDVQKERLKANQVAAVLDGLAPFVRADQEDDPVTACDRYLRNRLDHLDYQGAIQQGLPIGSGEIESAHRYNYPATT